MNSLKESTNIRYIIKGLIFSYIITAIGLLILSLIMLKSDLSAGALGISIVIIYIISTISGGFLVGKKIKERKFIWGMITGIFYFVIIFIISLVMNKANSIPIGNLFTVFLISSLGGTLGGMVS